MKLRAKALILLAALVITFVGFNAMVTGSSVDKMISVGHQAGYRIIANVVSAPDSAVRILAKG